MSVTQPNFDSYGNAGAVGAGNTGATPNAEFDLKDAQLDEAGGSNEAGFGPGGILSGGIGNITQNATQMVSDDFGDHKETWNLTCLIAIFFGIIIWDRLSIF